MKTTLHVHYCAQKYNEGFKFLSFIATTSKEYIYLGDIEIVNPFNEPSTSDINKAKVETIREEITDHKAKINLLENSIKDLLCIENKEN